MKQLNLHVEPEDFSPPEDIVRREKKANEIYEQVNSWINYLRKEKRKVKHNMLKLKNSNFKLF